VDSKQIYETSACDSILYTRLILACHLG